MQMYTSGTYGRVWVKNYWYDIAMRNIGRNWKKVWINANVTVRQKSMGVSDWHVTEMVKSFN